MSTANPIKILAFDIGIKNLAWCCVERPTAAGATVTPRILGWANENLLADSTAEEVLAAARCGACAHKASNWLQDGRGFCVRHCPPLTPALRDASGALLRKLPKLPILKSLAQAAGATKQDLKTKVAMTGFLATKYALPIRPGAPSAAEQKVKGVDLEALHDGIRSMIARNQTLFNSVSLVLLENQPVLKNPVMKSVQMMLFASLRDMLQPTPPRIKLVHAGMKTKGAKGGDEGYAERKGASEARAVKVLTERTVIMDDSAHGGDCMWFAEQKKRSDLADCLCMCLDTPLTPHPQRA
jgi:hypothetical protein